MPPFILIVDDDPIQRRLLGATVSRFGYRVGLAEDGEAALSTIARSDGERISLILLDLSMPGLDGLTVLGRLREEGRNIPVIVGTAHGGIDNAVAAMRAGAVDFIVKPASPERLQISIENALKLGALQGEVARLKHSANFTLAFEDILTLSPAMGRVIRLGERAAKSQIPILIEGESGVGKELIARAIQGSGERRAKPFVTVNCGAIPENLVESILFGHEKGAFTGAIDRHVGKFQEANGGTLFLDEIGELPLEAQVKLLRALQDGQIDPVGARKSFRVDIRLISATNRSLADLVRAGRFREDLYYRLNVFPIQIPPLRERREDIPELARHFAVRFAAEEGRPEIRGIDSAALAILSAFDWPGNVRQLENAVFRAVVLCEGAMLTPAEFPQITGQVQPLAEPVQPLAESAHSGRALANSAPKSASLAMAANVVEALTAEGDVRPLAEIEAEMIRLALDHYRGRMATVARKLGIGRSTLYRKLKEMGLVEGIEIEAAE